MFYMTQPTNTTRIAIAVIEHQGRYLVGTRPQGGPLAGYNEFPGGKVEPGESPREAAARECREEACLEADLDDDPVEFTYDYEHGRVHLFFFHGRPVDPSAEPAEPFCWMPRDKLADLRFPPANATIVAQLTTNS